MSCKSSGLSGKEVRCSFSPEPDGFSRNGPGGHLCCLLNLAHSSRVTWVLPCMQQMLLMSSFASLPGSQRKEGS